MRVFTVALHLEGVEILLVASCYRMRTLRPDERLSSYEDFTVPLPLKDAKRNIKISNFARTYTQSFIEVRH